MSPPALYEATRGIWAIGTERRERARYAMAVHAGLVREVYEIGSWHRAGSTPYETRDAADVSDDTGRKWEFVGRLAAPAIRDKYLLRSVEHVFEPGNQHPVVSAGPCD